jgi:hypothetical protein
MLWVYLVALFALFVLGQRKEHFASPRTDPIEGPTPADLIAPHRWGKMRDAERMLPDTGEERSDLTTKQHAIYMYKVAVLPFPGSSHPPKPYLNDFQPFMK